MRVLGQNKGKTPASSTADTHYLNDKKSMGQSEKKLFLGHLIIPSFLDLPSAVCHGGNEISEQSERKIRSDQSDQSERSEQIRAKDQSDQHWRIIGKGMHAYARASLLHNHIRAKSAEHCK